MTVLAGCGSSPGVPSARGTVPAPAQVVDDVPVNISTYPDLAAARLQAATALAARILSHMQPAA